jgi:hypothetical protein
MYVLTAAAESSGKENNSANSSREPSNQSIVGTTATAQGQASSPANS